MIADARRGIALIICAPSGAGKTTLTKKLLTEFPRFVFSVSCTTREPRANEVNGRDYHFINKEEFIKRRNAHYFAEWAVVHNNYYGTPMQAALDTLEQGNDILFDVDIQGAKQLQANFKELGRYIFILPPSRQILETRLRARSTDTPEAITNRLINAAKEIAEAPSFEYIIVNNELEKAYSELKAVYLASTLAPVCQDQFISKLLREWE